MNNLVQIALKRPYTFVVLAILILVFGAMAVVEALKKTGGDASANKLIAAMEGMSFDTPKGKMTFRKEDHQAMQSMYHFKIKVDPAFAWGVPELVREIKPGEMAVPIRNKR